MGACQALVDRWSGSSDKIDNDDWIGSNVGWLIHSTGGALDSGSASGRTGVEAFDSLDEKGKIFSWKTTSREVNKVWVWMSKTL